MANISADLLAAARRIDDFNRQRGLGLPLIEPVLTEMNLIDAQAIRAAAAAWGPPPRKLARRWRIWPRPSNWASSRSPAGGLAAASLAVAIGTVADVVPGDEIVGVVAAIVGAFLAIVAAVATVASSALTRVPAVNDAIDALEQSTAALRPILTDADHTPPAPQSWQPAQA